MRRTGKITAQTNNNSKSLDEVFSSLPRRPPPAWSAGAAGHRRIVLDSIDDAIERTEAVIAATERLRDALLHELLTRGVPGWHSEWKEAPGLGTIPACWEVVRLGDKMCKMGLPRIYKPERVWRGTALARIDPNHSRPTVRRSPEWDRAE